MVKKCLIMILVIILLLSGCRMNRKDSISKSSTSKDSIVNDKPEKEKDLSSPDESTVKSNRATALKGMSDTDIERLTSAISKANLRLEQAFMFEDLENRLSDSKSYYWNYLEATGEILTGYSFEEEDLAKKSSLGLSDEEFEERYGQKVTVYNEYDEKKITSLLSDLKTLVYNEDLKQDFENMIVDINKAAESHDVQYIVNVYRILHDMDYYLLRYGPEDVGPYVQDQSTIDIFYGVLTCYN